MAQTTTVDINAELAKLRAENEALRAQMERKSTLTLKVSEKGAVSLYGLGRFPVTLYAEQWERVCDNAPAIRAFVAKNGVRKDQAPAPVPPTSNGKPSNGAGRLA